MKTANTPADFTLVPVAQSGTTGGAGLTLQPNQSSISTDRHSSRPEGDTNKLVSLQETINEKLKYLKEALAEETKRREAVEEAGRRERVTLESTGGGH